MLVIEFIIERKYLIKNAKKVYIIIFLFIVLLGIIAAYIQIDAQVSINSTQDTVLKIFNRNAEQNISSAINISRGLVDSYIPIPQLILNFWDDNRIIAEFLSNYNYIYTIFLALIIFILPIFILKRKTIIAYAFGSFFILFIPFFIYRCFIRHYGHLFILFFCCLWISRLNKDDKYLIDTKKIN